jgi:hypothetical protein
MSPVFQAPPSHPEWPPLPMNAIWVRLPDGEYAVRLRQTDSPEFVAAGFYCRRPASADTTLSRSILLLCFPPAPVSPTDPTTLPAP